MLTEVLDQLRPLRDGAKFKGQKNHLGKPRCDWKRCLGTLVLAILLAKLKSRAFCWQDQAV